MLAEAEEIRPSRGSLSPTPLDSHYETVRAGMAAILRELGLAARSRNHLSGFAPKRVADDLWPRRS
jgi:hypothetical protein